MCLFAYFYRRKSAEWSRNLALETLIAKNSWATLEEMEKVIPFHLPRFKSVLDRCSNVSEHINVQDLTFASRFVITLMFLKVKCTRPMTYQYLTIEMLEKAKVNGGYIDQTDFKTSTTYGFDTIIIDEDVSKILNLYVEHVRPRLNPTCSYLFVNTNGMMQQNLCHSMTILVHQAIGKYIHPTRYRQIVETESVEKLSNEEQQSISRDQKHNSNVAKLHYQKRLSRDVAVKGKECMQKLTAGNRDTVNTAISNVLLDIERHNQEFDLSFLEPLHGTSQPNANDCAIIDPDIAVTGATHPPPTALSKEVKEEEIALLASRGRITFTEEEDKFLLKGIEKYGRGNWAKIFNDKAFTFHPTRNRNTLRIRADTAGFKFKYK